MSQNWTSAEEAARVLGDRQRRLGALAPGLGHPPELRLARRHDGRLGRRQDPVRYDEEPEDQQLVRGIRHGLGPILRVPRADAIPPRIPVRAKRLAFARRHRMFGG